jgi:sec-independent protein translocase protein TatC
MPGFDREMTFLEHLEELRWHVIRSVVVLVVCTVAAFVYHRELIEFVVLAPLSGSFPFNRWVCSLNQDFCFQTLPVTYQAISPTEQFSKALLVSLVAGFVVAFPYIVWEFWRFIKPGLHVSEAQGVRGFVFWVSLLFLTGVGFAYFVITPVTFNFLANFSISDQIKNEWRIGDVLGLITQFSLAGGLLFQLPMLAYWLARVGVVSSRFMRQYRRHAFVFSVIVAGIATPSPDVLSQLLLGIPIIGLYEISIWVARRAEKYRQPQA